jgi:hypothetical protein
MQIVKVCQTGKDFSTIQQHSIDSSGIIGPLEAKDGMIWLTDLGARDTPEKIFTLNGKYLSYKAKYFSI